MWAQMERYAMDGLRHGKRATGKRSSDGNRLTGSRERRLPKGDGQCYASQFISFRSGQR